MSSASCVVDTHPTFDSICKFKDNKDPLTQPEPNDDPNLNVTFSDEEEDEDNNVLPFPRYFLHLGWETKSLTNHCPSLFRFRRKLPMQSGLGTSPHTPLATQLALLFVLL